MGGPDVVARLAIKVRYNSKYTADHAPDKQLLTNHSHQYRHLRYALLLLNTILNAALKTFKGISIEAIPSL